jgi:hypothetical protein
MSTREKTAWISLVTTVLVWVPYFWFFAPAPGMATPVLTAAIVVQVLLQIGAHVVLRVRRAPKDERDSAIDLAALRNAYWVVLVALALPIFAPPLWSAGRTPTAQVLLACLVLGELARFGTQVTGYRRGV